MTDPPAADPAAAPHNPVRDPEARPDSKPTTDPTEDAGSEFIPAQWVVADPAPPRGLAGWALAFGVGGLAFSLFVGWAFPIGLIGVVLAVIGLRRPFESRAVCIWALVLSVVSVLYSAGWLLWAAGRADLLT